MTLIEQINSLRDELNAENYIMCKEYWDALEWEITIQEMEYNKGKEISHAGNG